MPSQILQLDPKTADFPLSGTISELVQIAGTNFPVSGVAMATGEILTWKFVVPYYVGGNVTMLVLGYSRTGQTTGNVNFQGALACISPGDAQSVESKAFATATASGATAINGTAKGLTVVSATLSNLDSIAANDEVELQLTYLASGTTMSGDFVVTELYLSYAGGAVSGGIAGPGSSTDTAIARWNGTGGATLEDSSVLVDGSNNVTGLNNVNGLVAGDRLISAGAGAAITGKGQVGAALTSNQSLTATQAAVSGLQTSLKAGKTYYFDGTFLFNVTSSGACTVSLSCSSTPTRITANCFALSSLSAGAFVNQTANNGAMTGASATATVLLPYNVQGIIVVNAACTLDIQAKKSGGTIAMNTGSGYVCFEL